MICSSCGGKEIYLMVDDFSYEENGLFAFDMEARLEADIPEYPKHVSEYVNLYKYRCRRTFEKSLIKFNI